MKTCIALMLLCVSFSVAQDDVNANPGKSKFRFSVGYGVAVMNPEEINLHIATSNTQMNAVAKSIKSMPELYASVTARPKESSAIVILRAGYLSTERTYSFTFPETDNTNTPVGTVIGSLTETYSAYPFSIGVGLQNSDQTAQFQFEFIYGLGYIEEQGSYIQTNGSRTSYTRSLFSPTYGYRAALSVMVPITDKLGIGFDLGYRYMTFNEYEDQTTVQASSLEFKMSGIQGGVGLTFNL